MLLAQVYHSLLRNPKYIISRRAEEEIIFSLKKAYKIPLANGKILIKEYNEHLVQFLETLNREDQNRVGFIDYNDWFKDTWNKTLDNLIKFLDIGISEKEIQEKRDAVLPLIKPYLRFYRT